MPRTKETRTSSGEGSIYYSEKKKAYIAQITWTDANGKSHRKSFTGKKRIIVKTKLDNYKKNVIPNADSTQKQSASFKSFCEKWMSNNQANTLKSSSYDRKVCTLENQVYPLIGDIPIESLSYDDVQTMVNDLRDDGLSFSTVKKALEAVSGCMRAFPINFLYRHEVRPLDVRL